MKNHSLVFTMMTFGANLISTISKKSYVGDELLNFSFRTSYFDQINYFLYDPNVNLDTSSSDFRACILVDYKRSALPCLLVFEWNKRLVFQHI